MSSLWPPATALELKFSFEVPEATPSNNVIKGMHFHAYKMLRRQWQLAVLVALNGKKPREPLPVSFLVITRSCVGSGLDWDNAYGGLKPLLDCLVVPTEKNPSGLGLILDDNPSCMPYPPFVKQLPAKRSESKTKVEIFAVQPL